MFSNKLVLAGIFVDPNYRQCLSLDQQAIAKNALMDLVLHLENAQSSGITIEISDTNFSFGQSFEVSDSSSHMTEEANSFERMLDRERRESGVTARDSLLPLISIVESHRRDATPVMTAIQAYPLRLRKACRVLTALPLTQVSVERLFSAVKLITPDLRASLSPATLEPILFLRSNGYH